MLASSPCRSACDWQVADVRLWACAGCGSQWEPGQPWAPRQLDGTWPPGVREAVSDPREAQRG